MVAQERFGKQKVKFLPLHKNNNKQFIFKYTGSYSFTRYGFYPIKLSFYSKISSFRTLKEGLDRLSSLFLKKIIGLIKS